MDDMTPRRTGVEPRTRDGFRRGPSVLAASVLILAVVAATSVAVTAPAFAQGMGLGAHIGTGAGTDLINVDIAIAVLKYLLAAGAGVGAGYYLWAIGRRNHHSGAHAGMVACAALAAFIAVSWGQTIQAGVQTLWQAAPDINNMTAVVLEQW